MAALKIRNFCAPDELAQIERLVSAVVQECYGHLIQVYRFDVEEDWPSSWLAEIEGEIVGVMLTKRDWLEDLWIARRQRRLGIGAQLLRIGEREIAGRGHKLGKLRVVADNLQAKRFYARHGWIEDCHYPHEVNGFGMVEMVKGLEPFQRGSSQRPGTGPGLA